MSSIQELMDTTFDGKATQEDIYYCFRLILGRRPNPEEISGHMARAGEDLTDIVSNYLSSAEFDNRELLKSKLLDKLRLTAYDSFSIYSHYIHMRMTLPSGSTSPKGVTNRT
jgi:hypothetical protein